MVSPFEELWLGGCCPPDGSEDQAYILPSAHTLGQFDVLLCEQLNQMCHLVLFARLLLYAHTHKPMLRQGLDPHYL
jgi:hypothetical protein